MKWSNKLKWIWKGRLMLDYSGYHCGCCGRWIDDPIQVPEYESVGEWGDAIGLCPKDDPECCWS